MRIKKNQLIIQIRDEERDRNYMIKNEKKKNVVNKRKHKRKCLNLIIFFFLPMWVWLY